MPTAATVTAASNARTVFRNMTPSSVKSIAPGDYDSFCRHLLRLQRKLMARQANNFFWFSVQLRGNNRLVAHLRNARPRSFSSLIAHRALRNGTNSRGCN
jgi:hypothetical protein